VSVPQHSNNTPDSAPVESAIKRFLSYAAPVPSKLTEQGRENAFLDLKHKLEFETDYEPPPEYWSALWSRPTHKGRDSSVRVQMQGSALRVTKKLSAGAEKGKVFERGWDGFGAVDLPEKPKGNKRAVHEFSSSSRRTLLDNLMSIEQGAWYNAKFLTLTYHDKWPAPKAAKEHLRAFFKRIQRYIAKHSKWRDYAPSFFWRLEVQDRKSGERKGEAAPHFHLFLFDCPYIHQSKLLEWWRQITEDFSITQLHIERLDNRRKAMNYVAMYTAKKVSPASSEASLDIALYLADGGRFWGFEGGSNLPFGEIMTVVLPLNSPHCQKFITVLETLYDFLLSRWSVGFRVFEFGDEGIDRIRAILEHVADIDFSAERSAPPEFSPFQDRLMGMDADFLALWGRVRWDEKTGSFNWL